MSNQDPVSEDIPLHETPNVVEDSVVKVLINENEKSRKRKPTGGAGRIGGVNYAANRNVADGMMDLALLTANCNQLRFLMTYNSQSSMYFVSMGFIVLSLVLQVAVGIGLIFKSKRGKGLEIELTNRLLIVGVFMITIVNILITALTTTDSGST